MFLILRSVTAVGPSLLLAFHPRVCKLLELEWSRCIRSAWLEWPIMDILSLSTHLCGKNNECSCNKDHHVEFARPDVRCKVSISHSGQSHYYKPQGVKQSEFTLPASLKVLDSANTGIRNHIDRHLEQCHSGVKKRFYWPGEYERDSCGWQDNQLLWKCGLRLLHGSVEVILKWSKTGVEFTNCLLCGFRKF